MLDLKFEATSGATVLIDGHDVSKTRKLESNHWTYRWAHAFDTWPQMSISMTLSWKFMGVWSRFSIHLEKCHWSLFKRWRFLGRKKYIRDLSKGNLKKVGIAAAMMGANRDVSIFRWTLETLTQALRSDWEGLSLQKKKIIQKRPFWSPAMIESRHGDIVDRIVLLEKGKII